MFLVGHDLKTLLGDDELTALNGNLRQLKAKQPRALLRESYFDGKKRLDDFGISVPPSMKNLAGVVGLPAAACEKLAGRLHLEGFVVPGQKDTDTGLEEIFARNRMAIEWPQAQVSTFMHGAAFCAVVKGETGEPDPLILMMPATEATGLWDVRRRGLSSALWVRENPDRTSFVLFLLRYRIEGVRERRDGRWEPWQIDRKDNPLARLNVTPLRHRPRMGRPFGISRITRPVMSLTDQAVRTMLRAEVSAEFFSAPQRYAMGADEEMFKDEQGNRIPLWQALLGQFLALPRDENGDVPEVGQFPQQTMQPHGDHLRMIIAMFSGETSIPVDSLGIIHDNPSSAEGVDARWADMVLLAELCQTEFGVSSVEVAQNVMSAADGNRDVPTSLSRLRAKWRNASTPTLQSQTQSVTMQIGAGALRPDSVVGLEQMGYDQTDIERIQAEHDKARTSDPLTGLGTLLNGQASREPADRSIPA